MSDFKPPLFHAPTWYQHACGPSEPFAPIETSEQAEVVIVGAGLAGLSTAAYLVEAGINDIAVFEQGQPGEGASGRNGGFVFGGYSLDPARLARQLGLDAARQLQGMTHDAVHRIRRRCADLEVPIQDHGVVLVDWFKRDRQLKQFAEHHRRYTGQKLEFLTLSERQQHIHSNRYGAALMEADAFHFNPLHYVQALSRWLVSQGVRLYGHSQVNSLKQHSSAGPNAKHWTIKANGISIETPNLVLSGGGYSQDSLPRVRPWIQPIGTYIAVSEPIPGTLPALLPTRSAVYDNRFAFDYYRRVTNDRLLWGGRISIRDRSPEQIEQLMRKDLRKVFPELADVGFDFSWGGWMSYARHQMPVLAHPEPGLWLAVAFGGHGMAPTNVAGRVLADAICGKNDRLQRFQAWKPVWAGNRLGRMFAQLYYWRQQGRDWLRAIGTA